MSDPAMPAIDLFEAIHTARAQRRLRPDPVPEALITRVLDAAIRAPSAGNAQNWHFVVVRDDDLRRQVGALYRKASDIADAVYRARSRPAHLTESQWQRMMTAGAHLWDHMGDAPVLSIPCLYQRDLPPRDALDPAWRDHYDAERAYSDRISRRQHIPRGAEHHSGVPCARPRHCHHHQPSAHRGGIQDTARHSRRGGYVCIDARGLAGEPLRPDQSPATRRSGTCRPLVGGVARLSDFSGLSRDVARTVMTDTRGTRVPVSRRTLR